MFSTISVFFFYVHSLLNYTLCRVTTPIQTIPSEIWHIEHKRRTSYTHVQHRSYVPYAHILSRSAIYLTGNGRFLKLNSAKLTWFFRHSTYEKTTLANPTKDVHESQSILFLRVCRLAYPMAKYRLGVWDFENKRFNFVSIICVLIHPNNVLISHDFHLKSVYMAYEKIIYCHCGRHFTAPGHRCLY